MGLLFMRISSKKTCRTPRRNEDAEAALQFSTRIAAWGDAVQHYFRNTLFLVQVRSTCNIFSLIKRTRLTMGSI